MIYVKPAPGLDVLDLATMTYIPPTGAYVQDDVFWHRLILSGDVVVAKPPRVKRK